jgi:hypothetical protein
MSFDFSHLKALQVQKDAKSTFVFFRIAGEPSLEVRPATSDNPEFFNAVLKQSKAAVRRARSRRGQQATTEAIDLARQEDIKLFVKYIIVDWDGVLDSKGELVPYSADACAQFLRAIPSDMFNELRNYCLDIENFRLESEQMEASELEELTGN